MKTNNLKWTTLVAALGVLTTASTGYSGNESAGGTEDAALSYSPRDLGGDSDGAQQASMPCFEDGACVKKIEYDHFPPTKDSSNYTVILKIMYGIRRVCIAQDGNKVKFATALSPLRARREFFFSAYLKGEGPSLSEAAANAKNTSVQLWNDDRMSYNWSASLKEVELLWGHCEG